MSVRFCRYAKCRLEHNFESTHINHLHSRLFPLVLRLSVYALNKYDYFPENLVYI